MGSKNLLGAGPPNSLPILLFPLSSSSCFAHPVCRISVHSLPLVSFCGSPVFPIDFDKYKHSKPHSKTDHTFLHRAMPFLCTVWCTKKSLCAPSYAQENKDSILAYDIFVIFNKVLKSFIFQDLSPCGLLPGEFLKNTAYQLWITLNKVLKAVSNQGAIHVNLTPEVCQ